MQNYADLRLVLRELKVELELFKQNSPLTLPTTSTYATSYLLYHGRAAYFANHASNHIASAILTTTHPPPTRAHLTMPPTSSFRKPSTTSTNHPHASSSDPTAIRRTTSGRAVRANASRPTNYYARTFANNTITTH